MDIIFLVHINKVKSFKFFFKKDLSSNVSINSISRKNYIYYLSLKNYIIIYISSFLYYNNHF